MPTKGLIEEEFRAEVLKACQTVAQRPSSSYALKAWGKFFELVQNALKDQRVEDTTPASVEEMVLEVLLRPLKQE